MGAESRPEIDWKDEENMAKKGVLFDVTYGELCTGAAAGCQLFCWIMDDEWISRDMIHSHARKALSIDDPNDKLGWSFRDASLWIHGWLGKPRPEITLHKIQSVLGDSFGHCRLWASIYQGTGNPMDIEYIQFFGLWDPITQKVVNRSRQGFQVFANHEDVASKLISNRPIARNPGSSTNITKISSWLHQCQRDHHCRPMQGIMPTRLIEIGGTMENISIRLRQTKEVGIVPFVALSYCWGGEQPMKCIKSNVDSYRNAIPFEKQPPTIKDTVKVCRGLKFQYLWVDALCIIQNDPYDKSIEIAKMPSIFGSAAVTIAAARSRSASQGYLRERVTGSRKAAIVPYHCLEGEIGSITLVKLDEGLEMVEPIDERGWTLQERLLSTRVTDLS